MDEVQQEVQKAAFAIYQKRIADAMASGEFPPFKASGMAYIRFAREERELFRLLFMRDRSHETIDSLRTGEIRPLLALIQKNVGIGEAERGSSIWSCGSSSTASPRCSPRPISTGRMPLSAIC